MLTYDDVDLANTIEIAQSMEAVQKDMRALKLSSPDLTVGKVDTVAAVSIILEAT